MKGMTRKPSPLVAFGATDQYEFDVRDIVGIGPDPTGMEPSSLCQVFLLGHETLIQANFDETLKRWREAKQRIEDHEDDERNALIAMCLSEGKRLIAEVERRKVINLARLKDVNVAICSDGTVWQEVPNPEPRQYKWIPYSMDGIQTFQSKGKEPDA